MSTMITYEKAVDDMTEVLTKKLRVFANEGRPFHFPRFMQYYAFDVIGQITVGLSSLYSFPAGEIDMLSSLVRALA